MTINRFNPAKQLKSDRLVVALGMKGTGKSTLMNDLAFHLRNRLPKAYIFSETEEANNFWSKGRKFPKRCMSFKFDEDKLKKLMKVQKRLMKRNPNATPEENGLLIIFDDLGGQKKFKNSETLNLLARTQRHLNIMIIVALQYAKDMPPDVRANADYVFALKCNIQRQRTMLCDDYFNFPKKDFDKVFNKLTMDRGCMVQDNVVQSTVLTDMIFCYRANIRTPHYRFGARSFQALA